MGEAKQKTKNRSRSNGSGRWFVVANGNSQHPTAEFRFNEISIII